MAYSKKRVLEISKSPYILMPVLLLMWGSVAAITKLLVKDLDSYQIAFFMFGISVAVLLVISVFIVKPVQLLAIKPKSIYLSIMCGVLGYSYLILYSKAMEILTAAEASMLNYLFPLFIVIFSIPINNEKLNIVTILSVLVGLSGMVLLITNGNFEDLVFSNLKGDILAVLAAVSWALFTILAKKNTGDMFINNLLITMVSFIFSVGGQFAFSNFTMPDTANLIGLTWLSMSNVVIANLIYFRALKYSTVSIIASFSYFTPVITIVFIAVILNEKMQLIQWIAFFIILSSILIQQDITFWSLFKKLMLNIRAAFGKIAGKYLKSDNIAK